ncbi:MAG: response regulator [Proteobacteria bacterium]|jgi:DNA-binding response OmpR family regulator|nr:response regulator [Pseudomonadota bacterium]
MNDGGNKTQLGKILLKRKVVSSTDLDSLLHEQQDNPSDTERLASRVLKRGLSDEVRLLRALSEQMGVPAINLDEVEFSLSNLDFVPREIAQQHAILPVFVGGESINLAMANPDEQRVVDEVEFVTGKRVFPHVALHAQLVAVIEACYDAKASGETIYRGRRVGAAAAPSGPLDAVQGVPPRGLANTETSGVIAAEDGDGEAALGMEIDVEFDSSFGQPADPPAAQAPPPAAVAEAMTPREPAAAPSTKKKILVVDDEDDIRLLISRVLVEKGYAVVTAGRGLEAIHKVQTELPDMIILDAMLPEVHGFDICKKIKGSKKYGHIPVIMISAIYRGWRYAQDLKDSYGVDDFIEKPFKLGEFIEKVEGHFRARENAVEGPKEDLSQQAERVLQQSVDVYKSGNIDRAIELLRGGIMIDPLAYKLHYNLGLLLGKKSLVYQAIRELESTLELAPEYFPALKNLALLYQKAGFKFKAIETWERALHHCEDDETRDGIKRHLVEML